jgi:hypothetical protein
MQDIAFRSGAKKYLFDTECTSFRSWAKQHLSIATSPLKITFLKGKDRWFFTSIRKAIWYSVNVENIAFRVHYFDVGVYSPTNAFLSPRWGGVLIHNVYERREGNGSTPHTITVDMTAIMKVFLMQIRLLLGIKPVVSRRWRFFDSLRWLRAIYCHWRFQPMISFRVLKTAW